MILYVICRRKATNLMILNQSIIDIFAGCATLLTDLFNKLSMIPNGSKFTEDVFCHVWLSTYIMGSLVIASTYNLVCITLERYFAITNPMKYDKQKVLKRLPIVIAVAWCSGMNIYIYI